MELTNPVGYLEKQDFSPDGNLSPQMRAKGAIFVMFQSSKCGHCVSAKPAFQQLANSGIVTCMTVQADGNRQSERDVMPMIRTIYRGFEGFPSYMMFAGGKRIPYVGGRDFESMKRFVSGFV